jgi:hypothetical protein
MQKWVHCECSTVQKRCAEICLAFSCKKAVQRPCFSFSDENAEQYVCRAFLRENAKQSSAQRFCTVQHLHRRFGICCTKMLMSNPVGGLDKKVTRPRWWQGENGSKEELAIFARVANMAKIMNIGIFPPPRKSSKMMRNLIIKIINCWCKFYEGPSHDSCCP